MSSQRIQDEMFMKSQLVAFCKVMNKYEAPLKQKHVRALIVGTHKLRSARIFWHAASRIQLEKNPVLTWKFCQLLHKLIHDGHRKVTEESINYCSRLKQLADFWQHLRTSGYANANTSYCKMLMKRLQFHKKFPSIPGNLSLTSSQIEALTFDINETYEIGIEFLDQLDELLALKMTVTNIMESFRWSSLVPQGQCLMAPLILVILDTSKLYDFLVKTLFKLHSSLPPDTLIGHRERFYALFRQIKKFYEEASTLQYFKYLVSIPSMPATAPNFLESNALADYRAPEAYLHPSTSSEAGDSSPPDSQSICDETIIDLSSDAALLNQEQSSSTASSNVLMPFLENNTTQSSSSQSKDELISQLQNELLMERDTKERLIQEAHSRIELYEARLIQMKQEIETVQQRQQQNSTPASNSIAENHVEESENLSRKAQENEERFNKMKGLYQQLREEHIKSLTDIKELRVKLDEKETDLSRKNEEIKTISASVDSIRTEKEQSEMEVKSRIEQLVSSESNAKELELSVERLNATIDELKNKSSSEVEDFRKRRREDLVSHQKFHLEVICSTAILWLEHGLELIQNAPSISYPLRLALDSLHLAIDQSNVLDQTFLNAFLFHEKIMDSAGTETNNKNSQTVSFLLSFANRVSEASFCSASASYTTSIQSFEQVSEQSRSVVESAISFYEHLKRVLTNDDHLSGSNMAEQQTVSELTEQLKSKLVSLEKLIQAFSANDPEEDVGTQLDQQVRQMEKAIQEAVERIEQLQKKSRTSSSGLKLEVNEKILGACTDLMGAVRQLVICSHDVQEEIVSNGAGAGSKTTNSSPREFYRRNHLWTEGLISAAKAVGVAANYLVTSADELIAGKGKFEQLIVASQEIGASVAQLFISSRVKAHKGSTKLTSLGTASKSVNKCTATLVATVKDAQQSLYKEKLLDFSGYSLHETKKEEMESQVRTLELEAELDRERVKLAELRKLHYHLAQLVADNSDQQQQ